MNRDYRIIVAVVGTATCLWGAVGFVNEHRALRGGYETDFHGEVIHVEADGPADRAGLARGDRVIGVDDDKWDDPWLPPSRLPIAADGRQTLRVRRDSAELVLDLVWTPPTAAYLTELSVDFAITLAFVILGLCAYLVAADHPGLILAGFGVCYGLANFPYPSAGTWDALVQFGRSNLSFLTTALLLHLLLVHPVKRRLIDRRGAEWLLYTPWLMCLAVGIVQWSRQQTSFETYRGAVSAVDALYMFLSLFALVYSWIRTPRALQRASGFGFVPLGLFVAIGPFVAIGVIRSLGSTSPTLDSPYWPLMGIAIPLGFALAVAYRPLTERKARQTAAGPE